MTTTTLVVPDISCEHCEHAIVTALSPQEGVASVSVDIPAKEVQVSFDERRITVDQLKAILAEEDYPVASARS